MADDYTKVSHVASHVDSTDNDSQSWKHYEHKTDVELERLLKVSEVREARHRVDELADRVRQRKHYAKIFVGGSSRMDLLSFWYPRT